MYRIELVANDGYYPIYHQNASEEPLPCYNPKLSLEVNEAGSLTFTVLPTHPMAAQLYPLSGFVRVLEDGDEIFYGRVLQRNVSKITGEITITCEGALAFLLDSEVAPYGKNSSGSQITKTKKAGEFFKDCLDDHNTDIAHDWRRRFMVGEVTIDDAQTEEEYSISSYTQTKSCIQSNLIDRYGGFLRVKVHENGYDHVLDYIKQYDTLDSNELSIGINVEDMAHEFDSSELYTVLRPWCTDSSGNTVYLTEKTLDVYIDQEHMEHYGRIVKTVEFKNAKTESALRTKAQNFIQNMRETLLVSSTVQYVDMHYLDGTKPMIKLGDRFDNIEGLPAEEYTVTAMDIDMEKPENSTVTLDNPKKLEVYDTGVSSSASSSSKSSLSKSSSKSSSTALKYYTELDNKAQILVDDLSIQVKQLDINVEGQFRETAAEFERISSRISSTEQLIEPWPREIEGLTYSVQQLEGSAVIQNSDFISNVVGTFEVWTGPDGKKTIHLVDGADLSIDDINGVSQSVGARLEQVVENGRIIDAIEGSALWTQRDQITGVCGEYDIITDPQTGAKTLVIKSGGGLKIRRNGTEFGVYDNGNLTGGIITTKLADGTATMISGDLINLNVNNDYASLKLDHNSVKTTVADHTNSITTMGVAIDSFQGSTLWAQRDQITGVCGEFDVVTSGGTRTLVVKSGGGMKIRRNNVEYGVYDNGNLTGGIIVDKLGDGTVTTKISGNIIQVGDSSSTVALNDIMAVTSSYVRMKKPTYIGDSISDWTTINGGTVSARYFSTSNGGALKVYNSSGQMLSVDYTGWSKAITDASVSSDTLTFTDNSGKTCTISKVNDELIFTDGNGGQFSFSKATADVSGSWSGSYYYITANGEIVTNESAMITGTIVNGTPVINSGNSKFLDATIDVYGKKFGESGSGNIVFSSLKTLNATPVYNAGWDYGLTQRVRSTGAASSLDLTVKTLDYGERFTITDTYTKSNGTTEVVKYTVAARGEGSVILSGGWDYSQNRYTATLTQNGVDTDSVTGIITGTVVNGTPVMNSSNNKFLNAVIDVYAKEEGESGSGEVIYSSLKTLNATPVYNAGWDYGLAQRVRSTGAASSSDVTVKTLDYGERFKITDTYTKSNGTTEIVNYVIASKNEGTVTLSDVWNSSANKYTVTATRHGETIGTKSGVITGTIISTPTINSANSKFLDLTVDVYGRKDGETGSGNVVHTSSKTINATPAYNAGSAAVSMATNNWSNTLPYTSSDHNTVTVSTTGRLNASGASDNLSRDITIYVTSTNNIAYARLGSTSGSNICSITHNKYNNGWAGCYADIGLNYSSDQTITTNGGSVTIYPAAQSTPSASHSSITTKGVKVTANIDLSGYYTQTQYNDYGTSRYNAGYSAGWAGCYADISLNFSTNQTITSNGISKTIYPQAKATPTSSHTSITSKGITVTANIDLSSYYTQAQYEANYTTGYNSGYYYGWKDGWDAYYDDGPDWISAYNEGNGTYSVWIPKKLSGYNYYSSSYGRGKGNGSSSTCEKWFSYSSSSGTTVTHSPEIVNLSGPYTDVNELKSKMGYSSATSLGNIFVDNNKHYYGMVANCRGTTKCFYLKII